MERKFCKSMLAATVPAALLVGASMAHADGPQINHPAPQPFPEVSFQQTLEEDGAVTRVIGAEAIFPEQDPWLPPDGSNELAPTNLLENVYSNMIDGLGNEVPNSLPSTPENPYNLHPDPVVSDIDPRDPTLDFRDIFAELDEALENDDKLDQDTVQFAIDILEGNPIDRAYSGLPLLHYKGPTKVKAVEPEYDENGNVIGGNVNVHQVWMRGNIEADTAYIDPSAVLDVPWTITYTVDVLDGGEEDWAPHALFMDEFETEDENGNTVIAQRPGFALDQSFFPMEDGKRYVFELAMPPGRKWNLTYHWGWRVHPPRVQVIENALAEVAGMARPEWEVAVFGEDPTASEQAKLQAISMLADLAPAKRMWHAFTAMRDQPNASASGLENQIEEAKSAFDDWQDRNYLPSGIEPDPDADITMVYANNTIYGAANGFTRETDNMERTLDKWRTRGTDITIKLYNADFYPRAYVSVDFGGLRGWENIYQNTIPVGGQGPWFTFGRTHWWVNQDAVLLAAAERPGGQGAGHANPEAGKSGKFKYKFLRYPGQSNLPAVQHNIDGMSEHTVKITMNHEPSMRLRLYQGDPLHHDTAIWAIH